MQNANLQSRKLRVYAFDPSLGRQLLTTRANEIVVSIPAEMEFISQQKSAGGQKSDFRGPVGRYLEVVDYDPVSQLFYDPVDLDDRDLLASQGLAPNVANPKFHQQMVYAVAMATIAQFEDALGRVALWSPRIVRGPNREFEKEEYVPRLRIYPHALREANAFYSPEKKALLFGYFVADEESETAIPGTTVFTCLSHDIIVHETTHALLDGMHSRFIESTNADVLALHEAFADTIAIFQHFSHPEVLEDQIAKTRGDLASENLLGQLAQEFGQALGRGAALRDALGSYDENGVWKRHKPDRQLIQKRHKPHDRGAILVAAIFDAFLAIYRDRTADLFRIATGGTGTLPSGAIHPDLVKRLSHEAAKAAGHLSRMCIRALDYCPPVDVTFGDYLRAIITADFDLFPEDERRYRIAIVEAFGSWGIVPEGVGSLSVENLLWPSLEDALDDSGPTSKAEERVLSANLGTLIENPRAILEWIKRRSKEAFAVEQSLRAIASKIALLMSDGVEKRIQTEESEGDFKLATKAATDRKYSVENLLSQNLLMLGLEANREVEYNAQKFYAQLFWAFITAPERRKLLRALGLTMDDQVPKTVTLDKRFSLPTIEVHAVRMATRRGSRNQIEREYVVEVTQRRVGFYDEAEQFAKDKNFNSRNGDFIFRRGCTLLIDARTFRIRRIIKTRGDICSNKELNRVRHFILERQARPSNAFYGGSSPNPLNDENFAHLHRSSEH